MRIDLPKTCLALAACWIAGCGGAAGDVSGEVKFGGKPLAGATVTFYDSKNNVASDIVADDGKYSVKGIATGPAKIAIVTPLAISFPGGLSGVKGEGVAAPKNTTPGIPAKYGDRETSGLTLEVRSGAQIHPINIE